MDATGGWLSGLRQPEYTGENRCLPCTAVNLTLAFLASVVVGVAGTVVVSAAVGTGAGVAVLLGAVGAVYLRGYLVPGTPELTTRHFPDWLLTGFGKEAGAGGETGKDALDTEQALISAGALEACPEADDLCLAPGFRETWYAEIDRVTATDVGRERLLAVLDLDAGAVEIEEFDDAFRARVDGRAVGTWESPAAFHADLAGARVLADRYPEWDDLAVRDRSRLLGGLRLFIDRCPACDGVPAFGTETVESCCSSHEVAAVSCDDCGTRLFESGPV